MQTPIIDGLVKVGVELDRQYAYRYCTREHPRRRPSPSISHGSGAVLRFFLAATRSSTLSGRLPVHVFEQAGHGVCNVHFGVPRGMTMISAKLKSAGYSTHQVAIRLDPQKVEDVYAVFGQEGHTLIIPPGFQAPTPFGTNVG